MKKQLTAMILAVSAAFMGVSFGVFADVASTSPTNVDIGRGNVSITSTHITYARDSGGTIVDVTEPVTPAGYKITGIQVVDASGAPAIKLQISDATVPLTLEPRGETAFQVSGDVSTRAPLTLNGATTIGGNLTTNAAFTANGALNIAGNFRANSMLMANRNYSAVPVVLNAPTVIGGNVFADHAFTANGSATTVHGDMTVQGQLTNKGQLTVKKNLTLSVPPVLQNSVAVDGNLTINTGDFTAAVPLAVGGDLQTKAGSLNLQVPVSAGSIVSSGNLLLNATPTTGSLSSGMDMALKAATQTGSITAGGALTADNVQVQTTVGGISARNALDLGGPVISAGPITSTAGTVTLRGPVNATGTISGVHIELKGVTNAAAIHATGGNLTADAAVTTSGDLQATGNMLFRQTARAGGNIQVQGTGNLTFNGAAEAGQTIHTNQGSIFAQGEVRAWSVQAPNGAIDLRSNVTAQNSILARDVLSIAGAANTAQISSASGAVTLNGNTTATTGVKGASVMVNNGAWLNTPNLNTPVTATNRFAVDVNTPFPTGTSVTVSATGVNAMPATVGAVRSAGLRLWLPAGYTSVTVQDGVRSYFGNVQVRASATPTQITANNSSSGGGGGGGGGSGGGGSDSNDEDDFWDDVADRIKSARSGDEIRLSASKMDHMPVWVLKELDGRNITLRVSHGSITVALNGKKLPSIPANKIFYQFDALKEWYEDGQKPEPSSSSETSSVKPSIPLPPASSTPQVITPPASSVAPPPPSSSSEESSSELEEPSSSEESSSEDEVIADAEEEPTPPEPEKEKRPILPLVIAGIVASLAAAGAVVGYVLYRRKSEEYLDNDQQDPPELPM